MKAHALAAVLVFIAVPCFAQKVNVDFDDVLECYNIDRNPGNILVTADYQLWMIDHTRAFQFKFELLDDRVTRLPRRSWERLLALTEEELRSALAKYLTPAEIKGIVERGIVLIDLVERLVAERGEGVVFY